MTARKTGLATAAWLFPYFLPRQPNKLNYKPVNPIKKNNKVNRTLPQLSVAFPDEKSQETVSRMGPRLTTSVPQPFPSSPFQADIPFLSYARGPMQTIKTGSLLRM